MVQIALAVAGGGESGVRTLGRWARNLVDLSPVMPEVAELFRQFEVAQFATEGGDHPWTPLSARYGRWKARTHPGRPILVLSGALRRDMTTRPYAEERATRDGITIVTTRLPYAIYHQRGTDRMPARPPIDLTEPQWDAIVKTVQRYIVESGSRVGRTGGGVRP